MEKITVVVNTLNEEKNLPHALSSVKNFADEIVVVDMKSDDKTQDVAKKYSARVFEHEPTGYVEPARNYAISKATGNWILILDADEELSPNLASELTKITENSAADYYRLPRKNIIFGKWMKHSRWWPDYNIRFFKKGHVYWSEIIHSVPTTSGKGLDLEAKEDHAIIHHHYETLEQYIDRLNRYTSYGAKSLKKEGYRFTWTDLLQKPLNEFLSRYFQGEGYKDGLHGLALSGLQGFSEFVKYLKVWQSEKFRPETLNINEFVEQLKKSESEMHYWESDTLLKEVGGLKNRLKRKFRLS